MCGKMLDRLCGGEKLENCRGRIRNGQFVINKKNLLLADRTMLNQLVKKKLS